MTILYDNICLNCGRTFETTRIVQSKFCSGKCRQADYRKRSSVTRKSQSGRCIRCGYSAPKGHKYCGKSCKTSANREKHAATFRLFKFLYGGNDYEIFMKMDGKWKEAYETLENRGYRYDAFVRTWQRPQDQLKLALGVEE